MDNPVAMVTVSGQAETWYYYFADALGSIRLLSDASGAIAESYAYDVYGRPSVMDSAGPDGNWLTEDTATYSASAVGNPYLFTARRWDAATGLYHYRHRDYSPTLGRFCQTDPLGYIAAMSGGLPCDLPEGGRLEHAAGDGLRQTAENRVRKGRSGRFVPDFYDFTAPIDDPVCL